MVKGSIRNRVFKHIKGDPEITIKELQAFFNNNKKDTIKRYYCQYKESIRPFDVKAELIKIIKDYKSPASSRVQAIRELNNMRKEDIKEGVAVDGEYDDGFKELMEKLDREDPGRHERQAKEDAKKKEEQKAYIIERLKTYPDEYSDAELIIYGIEPPIRNLSLKPPESFHENDNK